MLMRNQLYPHLSYEVITEVAQIINNNLRDGWVIRIEYTEEAEYLNTTWLQWGKAFLKINTPAEVMDNIFECHINNQLCSIRLRADKISLVSSLYYPIFQAFPASK